VKAIQTRANREKERRCRLGRGRESDERWRSDAGRKAGGRAAARNLARGWFRVAGFPCFRGVVFWQDFAPWRTKQNGVSARAAAPRSSAEVASVQGLPPRAAQILLEA